jgi:ubiquinone/menaquinone biosynthesis C-methylase UbiE
MKTDSRFDFDNAAALYDGWFLTPMGRYYDSIEKREIVRLLKEMSGKKLLEIGSGTGHWSKYFAALGFSVLGIDVSFQMLNKTFRKRIPWAGFVQSNALCLPIHDRVFDIAVFITSLEFMAEPDKAIMEAIRCIRKPGGHLLIGTLNARSILNMCRIAKKEAPYREAAMFSLNDLYNILSPYGKPKLFTCAFSLHPSRPIPIVDSLFNSIARALNLPFGDIIIGVVDL